jgi:hypothetical protein
MIFEDVNGDLALVASRAKLPHGIDMTLIERVEESETIGDDGYRSRPAAAGAEAQA